MRDDLLVAVVDAQIQVHQIVALRHLFDDGIERALDCPEMFIDKNHGTGVAVRFVMVLRQILKNLLHGSRASGRENYAAFGS